jgi:hypothetical protein
MTNFWQRFNTRVNCFFGWHRWSRYSGYYDERVYPGAHCLDCGEVYER